MCVGGGGGGGHRCPPSGRVGGGRSSQPPNRRRVTPQPPSVTPQPPSVTPQPPLATPQPPSVALQPPSLTLYSPSVTPQPPSVTLYSPSVTPEPPSITPRTLSVALGRWRVPTAVGTQPTIGRTFSIRVRNGKRLHLRKRQRDAQNAVLRAPGGRAALEGEGGAREGSAAVARAVNGGCRATSVAVPAVAKRLEGDGEPDRSGWGGTASPPLEGEGVGVPPRASSLAWLTAKGCTLTDGASPLACPRGAPLRSHWARRKPGGLTPARFEILGPPNGDHVGVRVWGGG